MIRALSLRALDLFATLMQTRNMTMAASWIGISQSAASLALKDLEGQLRTQLFTRTAQGMIPTEEAKVLLPEVQRLLAQVDAVNHRAASLHASGPPALRIASTLSIGGTILPRASRLFKESHSGVHLKIDIQPTLGVIERVMRGEVDIGLTDLPDVEIVHNARPLLTTWICCLMRPDHPLAGEDVVSIDALAEHSTVFYARGDSFSSLVRLRTGQGDLGGTVEINNVFTAMEFAREGVGVALMTPLPLLSTPPGELVAKRIDVDVRVVLALIEAEHGAKSTSITRFADTMTEAARQFAAKLEAFGAPVSI